MSRSRILPRLLLLVPATLLAAAASAYLVSFLLTREGEIPVPDLRGQEMGSALELASRQGLGVAVAAFDYDPAIPARHVISQSPEAGSRTHKNRIVLVVVSRGSKSIRVPDLAGLTLRLAGLTLSQSGLTAGATASARSPFLPAGNVMAQNPSAGSFLSRGEPVSLLLSAGPPLRLLLMRDLISLPEDTALALLGKWKVKARVLEESSAGVPPGTVTATDPKPGYPVAEGDTVTLTVAGRTGGRSPAP